MIRVVHEANRAAYGAPRVWAELPARGHHRMGPDAGGVTGGDGGEPAEAVPHHETERGGSAGTGPGEAELRGGAPDRLWVADITVVSGGDGPDSAVCGGGGGRLQPPGRKLGDGASAKTRHW